jgi:hypothetical protein
VSSLLISLKVDRMDSKKVSWHYALGDPDSEEYQRMEYESEHAVSISHAPTYTSAYRPNHAIDRRCE